MFKQLAAATALFAAMVAAVHGKAYESSHGTLEAIHPQLAVLSGVVKAEQQVRVTTPSGIVTGVCCYSSPKQGLSLVMIRGRLEYTRYHESDESQSAAKYASLLQRSNQATGVDLFSKVFSTVPSASDGPHPAVKQVRHPDGPGSYLTGSCTLIALHPTRDLAVWASAGHVFGGSGLAQVMLGRYYVEGPFVRQPGTDNALVFTRKPPGIAPMPVWTGDVAVGMPVWGEGYGHNRFGRTRGLVRSTRWENENEYDLPSIQGDSGGVVYTMFEGLPFWCGAISTSNYDEPNGYRFTHTPKLKSFRQWMTSHAFPLGQCNVVLKHDPSGLVICEDYKAGYACQRVGSCQPIRNALRNVFGGRQQPAPWNPRSQPQGIPQDFGQRIQPLPFDQQQGQYG